MGGVGTGMDLVCSAYKSINRVFSGSARHALLAILYYVHCKILRLRSPFISFLDFSWL